MVQTQGCPDKQREDPQYTKYNELQWLHHNWVTLRLYIIVHMGLYGLASNYISDMFHKSHTGHRIEVLPEKTFTTRKALVYRNASE